MKTVFKKVKKKMFKVTFPSYIFIGNTKQEMQHWSRIFLEQIDIINIYLRD